jgi:outer membrane lipoprotein SlyB
VVKNRNVIVLFLLVLAACAPAQTYQGRQLSCAGGVLGGAAAGGILGNQIGGGTGQDIATAVGAGLGALAGTQNPNCLAPAQAQAQEQIIGYDQYGRAIYAAPPVQASQRIVGYDQYGRPVYGR